MPQQPRVVSESEGQRLAWIGGSVHRIVVDGQATGGRLAAIRSVMRAGAASPVHVHPEDDETIFVFSGGGVVWAGDRRWEIGPGDTAYLPRGVPHTYRFTASESEILTICSPAGMDQFFRSAGWDLARPQPEDWAVEIAALVDAAAQTGQRLLGPPLDVDDEMPAAYLESSDSAAVDR